MNKLFLSCSLIQTIIMSSICSALGILHSPCVLSQEYRNCAELQGYFNNKYPKMRLRGFEKVEMQTERSMPFQSVYATAFFCNGGTHVMSYQDGINRVCTGYIVYYISPYSNDQGITKNYYAGRGKYQNRWIEQKIEDHCG